VENKKGKKTGDKNQKTGDRNQETEAWSQEKQGNHPIMLTSEFYLLASNF
jgi:hypothetical protein